MPDQDDSMQGQGLDDALDVVGHGGQVVPPVCRDRITPSALVNGDATGASVDPIDNVIPSSTRTTPVVQEDAGRLT
jgi:hypothetical protein